MSFYIYTCMCIQLHTINVPKIMPFNRWFHVLSTQDVGPGSPIQVRVKILKELQDAVANKRLEQVHYIQLYIILRFIVIFVQYAIQRLWLSIKDLLEPSVPMEIRHYVFGFIRSLIGGQYEELGMLRAHFLKVVDEHDIREDFQPW